MTDYTELVKALRCVELRLSCNECEYGTWSESGEAWGCEFDRRDADAAATIEALQAEVDKANKSADAYRAMYFTKHGDITIEKVRELDEIDCHFHSALIRLMYRRINELEAQLPKRGQWELIDGAEPMRWGCSRCKYMSWETSNYCPRCGAKMEVQE